MGSKRNAENTLTAPQETAISSLLTGSTVARAAEAAGVDRTTLYRWLKSDAAFVAAYNRARQEQHEATQLEVRALASEAVATIRELMTGSETSPAIRLRAAMAVLSACQERGNTGPDDPQEVEREWRDRDRHNLLLRSLSGF